jgi:hypothetical protein
MWVRVLQVLRFGSGISEACQVRVPESLRTEWAFLGLFCPGPPETGQILSGCMPYQAVRATLVGGSRGSTSSTASMGALVLEGLGGLTGEAVKSVGAGASELMVHFPNTAKKVPQNRPGYPDWAGKCIQLQYPLIPELGPSALTHLSGHPVPGTARQSGEIRHFCIPYGIPGSVEP